MKLFSDNITKNHKIFIFGASFLNAFAMIFISFFLMNKPVVQGDEKSIIKYASYLKTHVLGWETKPPRDEFLFINICYDKQLIAINDDFGFPIGNIDITDRKKLATFFGLLNNYQDSIKYVICDVFFKDPSQYDAVLENQLQTMPNAIVSYHTKNDSMLDFPIIDVNKGLADYTASYGVFYKYKLTFFDTVKTVPLKMHEYLAEKKYKHGGLISWLGDDMILNHFVLNFRIRHDDLFGSKEKRYPYINLGELLALLPDTNYIGTFIKDRIILIGDFEDHDIHKTMAGYLPGPLIMLNAYLALHYGDNVITWPFIIILFMTYLAISLIVFHPVQIENKIFARLKENPKLSFIAGFMSYLTILMILSIITYLFFNIHINILYISTYIYGLEQLINRTYQKFGLVEANEKKEITPAKEVKLNEPNQKKKQHKNQEQTKK